MDSLCSSLKFRSSLSKIDVFCETLLARHTGYVVDGHRRENEEEGARKEVEDVHTEMEEGIRRVREDVAEVASTQGLSGK